MPGNSIIGALRIVLSADSAELTAGLSKAQAQLRKFGGQMESIGQSVQTFGQRLTIGLTAPIAAVGVASIKAASDANEMRSAFNYVFGSMAKTVEGWAETTGDALGRSTYALQQQALAFQQLFKQAAPTEAAAAELSKQFTLLTQDLASFYNVSEDDALLKLRSGLVGETEPLRAFGVFLNAAAVEAKALQLGLASTSKALTEQDKIMARAALITEATKDAQGDAARTADSFANKTKALQAAFNELAVSVGTTLLPLATKLVTGLNSMAKAFTALSPEAQTAGLVIGGVVAAIGPLTLVSGAMIASIGTLTKAFGTGTVAATVFRGAITAMMGPLGLVIVAFGAAATAALVLQQRSSGLAEAQATAKKVSDSLTGATEAYERAALAAAGASGEARDAALKEAAAKRELAIQTQEAAKAEIKLAAAKIASLQADTARAISTDRYSFRGDAAGTIRPVLNAPKVAAQQKLVTDASAKLAEAIKRMADADKVLTAQAPKATAAIVDAGDKRKAGLDKQAKALDDAKDAIREYAKAERESLATHDLSSNQAKIRELQAKANEAIKLGLLAEADALIEVIDGYRQLEIEVAEVEDGQVDLINTSKDVQAAMTEMAEHGRQSFEDIADSFYQIGNAIDDIFYGISGNDWVGAFSGLTRALKQVQAAFSAAGTSADKFSAVAGVANAAGDAIGGTGGAALKGAASGAMAGFQLGGPAGAVVGGVLGAIGGIFGASKAKKRAKKEAAERARLEAERKAAEVAAAARRLDLGIMELQGKRIEALAESRKDELAAMDPSLRARQEEYWALQDAAELTAQRTSLERELLRLQNEDAATALDRADALKALDPKLQGLQQQIYDYIDALDAQAKAEADWAAKQAAADDKVTDARDALVEAADREASALADIRDRFLDLADTLAGFRKDLSQGDAAGRDPRQRLAVARAEFERVSKLAQLGNEDALGDLPGAASAFLDASRALAPNARVYGQDLANVRKAVTAAEGVARNHVSIAEQQLGSLESQVSQLVNLNGNVVSVHQAILNLSAALLSAQAVEAARNQALQDLALSLKPALESVASLTTAPAATVNVGGVDADALTAQLNAAVTSAGADLVQAGPAMADVVAAQVATALTPYLRSIAVSTSTFADNSDRWNAIGLPTTDAA